MATLSREVRAKPAEPGAALNLVVGARHAGWNAGGRRVHLHIAAAWVCWMPGLFA